MTTLDDILLKISDYRNGYLKLCITKPFSYEEMIFYTNKKNKIRVISKSNFNGKWYKTNKSIKNRIFIDDYKFMCNNGSTWKIDINVITRPIHAGVNPVYINPDGSQKTGLSWTKAFNKLNSLLCK